ncbi:MAG: ABC transporter permease [Acidobacteriota bacterium]
MKKTQYLENIYEALYTLRSHKVRSFLTVLGVIIGVLTVIVIASLLTGMRQNIVGMVEDYGTDNIYAFHLKTGFQGPPSREEWMRQPLTVEDAKALERRSTAIQEVAYQAFALFRTQTVRFGSESFSRANVLGVSPNIAEVVNAALSEGRFFGKSDDLRRASVCVIGTNVVEALFPHERRILGRSVLVAGHPLTVVGILEKRKNTLFGESDDDNVVYIPYRTMRKLMPRNKALLLLIHARQGQLAQAWDQTEAILRNQRKVRFDQPNNFDLNTADRMIDQFDSITATIGLVAIAISAVGLLVGGIGVMNIMLVSVTERTREIGVRKAVGAQRRDIIFQFLFEAMTLTTVGGAIGIVLAILVSYAIIWLIPSLPATIPIWAVVTGFTVSVSVGLIFGVWPAVKAAGLDPIESLRYE